MASLTLLWLTVSAASATDAAIGVGAGALLGEVTGGVLGGGIGYYVGASTPCRPPTGGHCWNQLRGLAIGGTIGTVTGAVAGAGVSAHLVGARPLPPLIAAGGTAVVGTALFVAGAELESEALGWPGLVLGVVGAPIAAGLAAGLTHREQGLRARVLPTLGATSGFEIRGAFSRLR